MSKRRERSGDVPGDAMASRRAFTEQLLKLGEVVQGADSVIDGMFQDEIDIQSIRFAAPGLKRNDWLVVVTALADGMPVVAFHDAPTFGEAVRGVLARMANRSIVFREDEYRKGQG